MEDGGSSWLVRLLPDSQWRDRAGFAPGFLPMTPSLALTGLGRPVVCIVSAEVTGGGGRPEHGPAGPTGPAGGQERPDVAGRWPDGDRAVAG
ncbi:hypothetical protein CU044_7411 [Streptomyces sp. L-9-10]|nr:hypothetical protein CU044_7411 [Streptomyces sp. L-9-10]